MKNKLLLCVGLLLASVRLLSQNASETALNFLRANAERFELTASDVADVRISDQFLSQNNGLTHVWMQQQHAGVPVFNGLFGLHVTRSGEVLTVGHRFVARLSDKVKNTSPSLTAEKALLSAMASINFGGFDAPVLRQQISDKNFVFDGGVVSSREIPVALVLLPILDGTAVRLAWDVLIWQINSSAVWGIRVDAATGEILEKKDMTSHCKFPESHDHAGGVCIEQIENQAEAKFSEKENGTGGGAAASYNVFALPVESPAHGSRSIVNDPSLLSASPLGWHATGDLANQKFTYTRGNNIRAYDDSDSNNQPPSAANEVDGTATLTFNFPFDNNLEPEQNRKSAVTNLFYITNTMHDLAHKYGMDEVGGAYQTNNFGKGGLGNDHVNAEALDGSGTDNANFSPSVDGQTGRIQMYKWAGTFALTANAPAGVAKNYLSKAANGWGAPITQTPVTGEVVVVDDGASNPPSLGCNTTKNDVKGKIVMVDRGICEFGEKALFAEEAGAIGCIICNYENQLPNMGAGSVGGQVTIPVIGMRSSDCDLLRQFAGNGLNVSLVQPPQTGPNFYDGDFDNGIIAHEYGHGISNRLVGGPSTASCLGNPEQMGEGWSDFFSLAATVKAGDTGAKRRAVGTYVFRENPATGGGIRRYPYSTDMSVNPFTFYNVAHNTEVHSLGEIWTVVLWDLYWAMVEKYGWSPDLMNGTAGNNKCIQLVMDGMKLVPCSPGFVDGRDAILKADLADFNGENQCLIWKVFARRGLGEGASQGSTNNGGDGRESFEVPLTCQNELTLKKTTQTPLINPGDDVKYVITVRNGKKDPVSNVVVTDEIPAGLTPVAGTINNGGQFSGGKITWNIGGLQPTQSMTLTYTAKSDLSKASIRSHFDDLEDGAPDWLSYSLLPDQNVVNSFNLQSNKVKSGTKAFKADNSAEKHDFMAYYTLPIKALGTRPTLRFWHAWQTEAAVDGGFVEISTDEKAWKRVARSQFLRNGYTGGIPYSTVAIPYNDGFWGTQATFLDSYVDLSDYKGQEIFVRFRFVSDDATGADGWYFDDVEMLDLFNYDSQACATSGQGDNVCAKAAAAGVIVNSNGTISANDLKNQMKISVQPNPAHDFVSVFAATDLPDETRVFLVGMDGKVLRQQFLQNLPAGKPVAFDLSGWPQGVYFLKIESGRLAGFEKVVRQ